MTPLFARLRPESLRWRLLRLVTVASVLVWVLAGVLSYRHAGAELRELMDAQMDRTARMLLAQVQFSEDALPSLIANMAALRGPHVHRDELPVEFQILRADGTVLVRSKSAPAVVADGVPAFSEVFAGADRWRSLILTTENGDHRIQVLQSIRQRDRQVLEMASQAVVPLLVLFPLLMGLIFVSVRRGLEPLDRLAGDVSSRSLENLSEVVGHAAPLEARPLIAALNDLLRRLARTLENERRFTADAAHELRTPLAVVKVQAQVALGSKQAADREHALQQVLAGTDRATRLVEQLLRMARLDPLTQLPDPHPVDLPELARQLLARMYEVSPEAARRIEVDVGNEPLPVAADQDLLAVALRNLLDNALRYTPADSLVTVRVRREREEAGQTLCLSVIDAGEGVPVEELSRLTERFYRGGESTGSTGNEKAVGSGLGLAIVQRIAELHGARLAIENRPGGGLEVSLCWSTEPGTNSPE